VNSSYFATIAAGFGVKMAGSDRLVSEVFDLRIKSQPLAQAAPHRQTLRITSITVGSFALPRRLQPVIPAGCKRESSDGAGLSSRQKPAAMMAQEPNTCPCAFWEVTAEAAQPGNSHRVSAELLKFSIALHITIS
jgi:hypothetical protein